MENILCQPFRMYDSGRGIEGQAVLHRSVQIEQYLDRDARNLSWNSLVFGKDVMGRVTVAAEFDAADRQIDYHGGQVLTLRQTHCTRGLCVKAKVLSFFPVHVALVCMLPLVVISFRIHFVIQQFRNHGG